MLIRTLTNYSSSGVFLRERILPRPGKLFVRKGQQVFPRDVIAETCLVPEFIALDVGRGLGLEAHECNDLIQRKVGDVISEGDVIAVSAPWVVQRSVRAPMDGRIIWVNEGIVLLEKQTKVHPLRAAYPGLVVDLIAERGAVIETAGALVQAVWGNKLTGFGRLLKIKAEPEFTLQAEMLENTMCGQVVLGGICNDLETLQRARNVGLAGLILSGMAAKLIPTANELGLPVLVIEGFGNLAYNSVFFDMLMAMVETEVVVNGQGELSNGTRPEVLSPLPSRITGAEGNIADGAQQRGTDSWTPFFFPGQQVRVIQLPYRARVGTISHVFSSPQRLANGLQEMAAKVMLDNREEVIIPLSNLDVL